MDRQAAPIGGNLQPSVLQVPGAPFNATSASGAEARDTVVRVVPDGLVLERGAYIQRNGAEFYRTSGWANKEVQDSYGTIFNADCWDLKQYKRNPALFYMHSPFTMLGQVPSMLLYFAITRAA